MWCQAQNRCPTEVIFYMYDITITPYYHVWITYDIHYQDANQTSDPKKLRTRGHWCLVGRGTERQ